MAKVIVGLSGGVDSALTSRILLDKGFEVVGVFLENFPNQEKEQAQKVADSLGIEFRALDTEEFFSKNVKQKFFDDIAAGKTPNPCVECNRVLKFGHFYDIVSAEMDADFLATGHYARVEKDEKTGKYQLKMPRDDNNDQTYFLHQLSQEQLSHIIFPLGDLVKDEVRELAKKVGLPNHAKKSSSDICFLKNADYKDFMREHFPDKPGKIVDFETRKVLGDHKGVHLFTVGQRKNLGIGGVKGFAEKPFFVVGTDSHSGEVFISQNEDLLYKNKFKIQKLYFEVGGISFDELYAKSQKEGGFPLQAKIRFRGKIIACRFGEVGKDNVEVEFEDPILAPAVGQFCVFYDGDVCLGGGEIC